MELPDAAEGGAMPVDILRLLSAIPGIVPVEVMISIPPPVRLRQLGVVPLRSAVGLSDDHAGTGDAEILPDAVSVDVGQIPLRLGGRESEPKDCGGRAGSGRRLGMVNTVDTSGRVSNHRCASKPPCTWIPFTR